MISISSLVILRLAGTVHLDGEGLDHVARIAGGIVHRRHLGGEEAGLVLQQRGQQLHRDVLRQQRLQDGVFVRLVIIERRRAAPAVSTAAGISCLTVGSGSPPT